jgi:multidrug efflux system membrane fusion protein
MQQKGPQRPVPVSVAEVVQKDVPIEVKTVGSAEAIETVEIVPQVAGLIQNVHFNEGDFVKAGDPLFTIDTRPYTANLSAARANLAKNRALADEGQRTVARLEKLRKDGIATEQELSAARAGALAQQATLNADRANIASSSLNVQFARIQSPISGRTGSLLVNAGNVVRSNETRALVVIRSVAPIYVRFAVPEQYLSGVRDAMKKGAVPVVATPRGGGKAVSGELTFIENTVDSATGKVDMKGKFDNDDETLWPGQFVDVVLRIGLQKSALVLPEAAVQTGQDGPYTYVVGSDQKVALRRLTVDRIFGSEIVVKKGVAAKERVVIDGQIRVTDGSQVEIKAPTLGVNEPIPSATGTGPKPDKPTLEGQK